MLNIKSKMIAKQFKKPTGILGNYISKIMEKRNSSLYDNILEKINSINNDDNILEIGFGPGIGLNKILKETSTIKIDGIDFSKLMYKKSMKKNKKYIKDERLKLIHSNILDYDFKEKKYKLIIAINVIYFWNPIENILKKTYQLLKKNGLLILFFVKPNDLIKIKFTQTDVFNKYKKEKIIKILKKLGFKKLESKINIRNDRKGFFIYAYK